MSAANPKPDAPPLLTLEEVFAECARLESDVAAGEYSAEDAEFLKGMLDDVQVTIEAKFRLMHRNS